MKSRFLYMRTMKSSQAIDWRQILRSNFNNWKSLADFLELDESQRNHLYKKPAFSLNFPLRLAQKCAKGCLDDPILQQFVPTVYEQESKLGFIPDPTKDLSFCKTSKMLKKYAGRVLLICTSACAMHCRYCFRQNFNYNVQNKFFDDEIEEIKKDSSIFEVILSGGDPLSLSNEALGQLIDNLCRIPHVRRIRFHTRFPIGIPERIDCPLLEIIENASKQVWFILHANHPKELDGDVLAAMEQLRKKGAVLLCQTVLLRGINDSVETLSELFFTLVDHGIQPYYLHQLDRVQGAAHFEVSIEQGKALMKALSQILPGYALPRYVQELAGEPNKTILY